MIALPLPPPRATHASSPSFRDRLRSYGPYQGGAPSPLEVFTIGLDSTHHMLTW